MSKINVKIWVWPHWRQGVERRLRRISRGKGWDLVLTFSDPDHLGFSFQLDEPDSEAGGALVQEVRDAVCQSMAAEATEVRGREVHVRSW